MMELIRDLTGHYKPNGGYWISKSNLKSKKIKTIIRQHSYFYPLLGIFKNNMYRIPNSNINDSTNGLRNADAQAHFFV